MEENGKRDSVQTTDSGLQYEVIKSGPQDGSHPEPSSKCVVNYRGQLLNGVEFDSSYKRNAPATFSPSGVVPGFKEALLLMRPGDSWKVWLPSQLGYGSSGAGSNIPANAALLFELELLEVQPPAEGLEWVKDQIMANPMMLVMVVMLGFQVYNMMGGGGGAAAGKQALKIAEAADQPENSKVFLNIKIGDDEAEKELQSIVHWREGQGQARQGSDPQRQHLPSHHSWIYVPGRRLYQGQRHRGRVYIRQQVCR
jgi:hypothetical protein